MLVRGSLMASHTLVNYNLMNISIGSTNNVKIESVKELIRDYPLLQSAEVIARDVSSEVSVQPKTLEETIRGAMNRARAAFQNSPYSFGIESGLMKILYTKTEYMDVTACAIYDGKQFHLGLSSAFEYPKEATRLVLEEGLDITQAFNKIGLTDDPNLGAANGAVAFLTKGRITRKEYTQEAIRMALIHLEHPELY